MATARAAIDIHAHMAPADALAAIPPGWRSQGVRVLVSDLLWLGDPMATLDHLAQGAAATTIVQVLAAADVDPPRRGNTRLVDCETNEIKEVFIDAAAEGRKVRITKVPLAANPKALIVGDPRGFVKVISDPATRIVLGGTVVGRHAAELIAPIALAVTARLKVDVLFDSMMVHPSLSESVSEAAE